MDEVLEQVPLAGRLQGVARHGHPVVGRDHQKVHGQPDEHQGQPGKPDVLCHERQQDGIRGDEEIDRYLLVQVAVERQRNQLHQQAERCESPPPQAKVLEAAKPPPGQVAEDDSDHEDAGDEQHEVRTSDPEW